MTTQVCCWDFTFYAPGDFLTPTDYNAVITLARKELGAGAKKWEFQLERCPTTAKLHLQGRLQLWKKKTRAGVLALLPSLAGAHLGPTANVNTRNFNYVAKADTRVTGPFRDSDPPPMKETKDVRVIDKAGLRPWQAAIKKTCDDQADEKTMDDRSINVLITAGGIGKGTFKRWCKFHRVAMPLPPFNDTVKMIGFAIDLPHHAYIFDMPRGMKTAKLGEFYAGVETLKDGDLYDHRFKGRSVDIERPCVWIFTNTMPDLKLLSVDRWKLWTVDDKQELVPMVPVPETEDEPKKKKQKVS